MSDDIVYRLRSFRPPYGWPEEKAITPTPTLNNVAADEITRLRADLAAADALAEQRLRGWVDEGKEKDALRAELDAARALLRETHWSVEHCRLLKLLARIDAALKGDASD